MNTNTKANDRLIAPLYCEGCGAPLDVHTRCCTYCRLGWEFVDRYRGPDIPDNLLERYSRPRIWYGWDETSTRYSSTSSYMEYYSSAHSIPSILNVGGAW